MLALPWLEGVEHHQLRVGGIMLHVACAGAGEPLLLLHGWPQHWYMWRYLLPRLTRHYRVLCPDFRGQGWSAAPRAGYLKEQLADDILGLLDELRLPSVRLMGHDWGAWVGFLLALRAPRRIRRFAALGIVPPWPAPERRLLRHLPRFWYQAVLSAPVLGERLLRARTGFVARLIRGNSARPEAWRPADLEWYAAPLRERARARASVRLYRTFLLREALPVLRGRYRRRPLEVPTLLVLGRQDRVIKAELVQGQHRTADRMQLELVEESGHFLPEEVPELIADRAEAFFQHQ